MAIKALDVVAAILHREGKILLAQRNQAGDQPDLWEFPGGKVEAGESQPEALRRELYEELGICASVGDWVATESREVSGRLIHLHGWQIDAFTGEPQTFCHQALTWCTCAEAMQMALAPADVPLLLAFMALPDATPAD